MDEHKQLIFQKESQFRLFQLWPLATKLDLKRWLTNFDDVDQDLALRMADVFYFISEPLVDAMLKSSLQRLVNALASEQHPRFQQIELTENAIFVKVEGECPSPTDSGNFFARKLRDRFGVSESRILSPQEALKQTDKSLFVFVDDFIGSGQQMYFTWNRHYDVNGRPVSFNEFCRSGERRFAYCAPVCTATGAQFLSETVCPLLLFPAHKLSENDSLLSEKHVIWSGVDHRTGLAFLQKYADRCGFSADNEGEDDWGGFNKLGLALSFHHGTPDATLPIFRSQRNGWKPLVERQA